jgi:hypothetical protein
MSNSAANLLASISIICVPLAELESRISTAGQSKHWCDQHCVASQAVRRVQIYPRTTQEMPANGGSCELPLCLWTPNPLAMR